MRSSNWFMAIWRKTVAIEPSIDSASSDSRDSGVSARSSRRPNTIVSPNTLAVSASVSGVAMWKMPWLPPSAGVDAVAELVRERQHVAAARGPVEHHVRVHGRHRVGAERARALAGPHRRVDPVLVKKRWTRSPSSGEKVE